MISGSTSAGMQHIFHCTQWNMCCMLSFLSSHLACGERICCPHHHRYYHLHSPSSSLYSSLSFGSTVRIRSIAIITVIIWSCDDNRMSRMQMIIIIIIWWSSIICILILHCHDHNSRDFWQWFRLQVGSCHLQKLPLSIITIVTITIIMTNGHWPLSSSSWPMVIIIMNNGHHHHDHEHFHHHQAHHRHRLLCISPS